MIHILKRLIAGMFRDWNGLQNIIAPTLLIFLFDEYSFVNWITNMFTFGKQYLVISLYLGFLLLMIFFVIKSYFDWHVAHAEVREGQYVHFGRDYLLPFVIHIHKHFFVYLTLFMLAFIMKSIYSYMYQGKFPLFSIYYWLIKGGAIVGVGYVYFFSRLSIPLVKKGHSWQRTTDYLAIKCVKRSKVLSQIVVVQAIWIYVSVLVFKLFVSMLDHVIIILGLSNPTHGVTLRFLQVQRMSDFLFNIGMILVAYVISNLIYLPFIIILNKGFQYFHLSVEDF